jgi:hypothetical protein
LLLLLLLLASFSRAASDQDRGSCGLLRRYRSPRRFRLDGIPPGNGLRPRLDDARFGEGEFER